MFAVNLRGTHGSGKSTVAIALLRHDAANWFPWYFPAEQCIHFGERAHRIMAMTNTHLNLAILGKYETACGGCDGIKTQDQICWLAEHFVSCGMRVFYEGALVSGLASRYIDLARRVPHKFLFLDTPLDVAIERVNLRRAEAGKPALLDNKNIEGKHRGVLSCFDKFKAAKLDAKWIPWQDPMPAVKEALCL